MKKCCNKYSRVHVILQDCSGLSGDFWLKVFDELLSVVIDEPEHSLGQDGFAGLEELPGTASTIIFGKQTFHLNVYVVQVEVELECFGLQVAVISGSEIHFNRHIDFVGRQSDVSSGRSQVQVGRDGSVQLVDCTGVKRREVNSNAPGSTGGKYFSVFYFDI